MKITNAYADIRREELTAPFGFKGRYVNDLWIVSVTLESGTVKANGSGTQSILWSDEKDFDKNCCSGGNILMFALTNYALKLIVGESFDTPEQMLDFLLPKVLDYGKKITHDPSLRTTFVLNALVGVDYAAWTLFAKLNGYRKFDEIIPDYAKQALSYRANALARLPAIPYGIDAAGIKKLIDEKNYFLKFKMGHDPDGDGSQKKMVEWDKQRLKTMHDICKDLYNPDTTTGFLPYYLDPNGRYETKGALLDFLDYADKIGATERILFIEEPFDEKNEIDVSDIPVRFAADEGAHTLEDAKRFVDMGYKAIALKPIAKTQSMSFRIASYAKQIGIPVFCADLTVPPDMLEWNKQFASRLDPLPTLKIGVVDSNGHQNYVNWQSLLNALPEDSSGSREVKDGKFHLNSSYFENDFCMLL